MSLTEESRTVLKLVLARGKSYAEIGALLGVDEAFARTRAHQALSELSAPGEPELDPAVTDFLLGQGDPLDTAAARREIERDPALAEQCEALREQLALVAPAASRPATPARTRRPSTPVTPTPPADLRPDAGSVADAAPTAAAGGPAKTAGGPLTAAQRRLVAALLGAALLATILVLVLTGVIGGSGDQADKSGKPTPTTAVLRPAKGESGSGTAELGVAQGTGLALRLRLSDLKPTGKNEAYTVWLYGSKGAFPINELQVDKSGSIAGDIALNEAMVCLISLDVFPELRVSRVTGAELARTLAQARRANRGKGKIPDYTGETVLAGQISMAQETRDFWAPRCAGGAAQQPAG